MCYTGINGWYEKGGEALEKRTRRTEVPVVIHLILATQDVTEVFRLAAEVMPGDEEVAVAESAVRTTNEALIKGLCELLAEHDKQPPSAVPGAELPSIVVSARGLVKESKVSAFSAMYASMVALQEYCNSVQVLDLSPALMHMLDQQVEFVDEYRVRLLERYRELSTEAS